MVNWERDYFYLDKVGFVADHKYYAELGVNAAEAVKAFSEADKSATGLTSTLSTLSTALETVGKTSDKAAGKQGNTLKLYQQMAGAAGAYGRALKTLNDPAAAKGSKAMTDSLKAMNAELNRMKGDKSTAFGEGDTKNLTNTLNLYKQLAQAAATYTSSLRNEASAIKAVADAEARRANISQQAANAGTRGADIWGVDKSERDDRARAKTVVTAEREMNAQIKKEREALDKWFLKKEEERAQAARDRAREIVRVEKEQTKKQADAQTAGTTQARARNEMDAAWRTRAKEQRIASQEMNAEFEARAQAQLKANGQTARGAEATRDATAANQEHEKGLASTRYALYEIAAAYTAVSAAAFALPVASARTAIAMEQQFAHVARTTQAADAPLANLKRRFQDLSTEIPITFEELSKIGTLGAQMGIASSDLEKFADTVAKFSATTNVTAEQAAMSFGRLSNMLHLTQDDYENLGASVSEMGTASVATESEILAIAEGIATSAKMAGFAAHEVVGLSTAMASLRIRPEMARGAMQRIFASINAAVADGTEKFGAYADALGVSTATAEDMYRNDPSEFLMRISQAVSEMDDNVARSQFIREGLGLRNVRDIEVLSRLSNGYEVYADSMLLAQDAYARGNYLETESGVIFETTAASLEKLSNAFSAMLDSFGQDSLGPIQAVAELLISLMNGIRDLPSWAKGSSVALLTVVGAMFAMRAGIALALASMRAFRLVNQQLQVDSMASTLSLRNLGREFSLTFLGGTAATTAATGAVRGFRAQLGMAQGAMAKTSVAARGMWTAIGGPIGLIAIIASVGAALWGLARAHENADEKARAYAETLAEGAGGFQAFNEAVQKDTKAAEDGGRVYMEFGGAVREASDEMKDASGKMGTYLDAHGRLKVATEDATAAIRTQSLAIGENADEFLRNALVQSESIQGADPVHMQELIDRGFSIDDLLASWYENGTAGAEAYIQGQKEGLQAGFAELDEFERAQSQRLFQGMLAVLEGAGEDTSAFITILEDFEYQALLTGNAGLDAFEDVEEGAAGAAEEVENLGDQFSALVDEMFGLVDAEAAVYAAMDKLGSSIDENGLDFRTVTEEGRSNLDALKGYIGTIADDIAAQVDANVISADQGAQAFAQAVTDIVDQLSSMGVDTTQFEEFITGLDNMFGEPVEVVVDTRQAMADLSVLQAQAENLGAALARISGKGYLVGEKPRKTTTEVVERVTQRRVDRTPYRNLSAETAKTRAEQIRLNKEQDKGNKTTKDTAEQAAKLRKEIEDINDPARLFEETMKELASAFKDTLDDFNGLQSARDSMESQLHSMRDAAQAAVDKVSELREEAAKLRREAREERVTAEQSGIFARVASRYGDTARKNQYTLEADQANAAAKEKDKLAKAAAAEAAELDKNKFALTGYSKQAIENRGQVRALEQEMADLIIAYANTGASTRDVERYAEDLRRKFIDQVTQMGYNRTEVKKLSTVFIDLKKDIDRVPREVRIKARADTAEAKKKIRDLGKQQTVPIKFAAAQQDFNVTGKLTVPEIRVTKQIRTNNFEYGDGKTSNSRLARGGVIPGKSSGKYIDNMLAIGHGFDGTVAVRSGEGVINEPALNRMGGEPWLNAINSMKMPPPTVVVSGGGGAGGGSGQVDLSARSLQILAQQLSSVLVLDGKVVSDTANSRNTGTARRGAN